LLGRSGVELAAAVCGEFGECLFGCEGVAVGASAGHCFECVGDGDDPRFERDLFAGEAGGVAGAVEAFVVVEDPGCFLVEFGSGEDRMADRWVYLDCVSFVGVEFAGFAEDVAAAADYRLKPLC
jgi:hypothetical protein